MNANPKILFVDDDPAIRDTVVMMILKRIGILSEVASNGQEALQLMERQQPDILITDTNMPHKNGYELIQEVRYKYPHILVYSLFSGLDHSSITKEDIGALGVALVLEKNEIQTRLLPALESVVSSNVATFNGD